VNLVVVLMIVVFIFGKVDLRELAIPKRVTLIHLAQRLIVGEI